jgi:translocation and assembly module TamB
MKRASAALAALALAAAAALVIMPELDKVTRKALTDGVVGLRSRVEGSLGLSLSFDALSPSIIRSASLSRLEISAPGGRTLLSARRARATYNILAILGGKSSEAINGVDLADVTLDLRLPEDAALLARLSELLSGGGGSLPRIAVSGKNVTATIEVAGKLSASFTAREVGVSTLEAEPVLTLDGRFSIDPYDFGLGAITGPLFISGSFSRGFDEARFAVSIAAESREAVISPQRFELAYGGGALSLTKVQDRSPLDAALRLDLASGDASASLKMDGYVPSRMVKFTGRYAALMSWLNIPYTGSLTLKAPGRDLSRISYEAKLSGLVPASLIGRGEAPARAELEARGDASSVSIKRAAFALGGERVAYSGSFRFADLAPDGLLELKLSPMGGRLSVSSSVHVFGHGGEYVAMADEALVGGVAFKDIALAAARNGVQTDFNLSFRPPEPEEPAAELPAARFSGEAGSGAGLPLVRCEGSVSSGETPSLEVSVDLEAIDLGPLKSLLAALTDSPEAAALLSSIKLGGSLFATSDFKRLSWSAPDLTIVSRSIPGAYAVLSLSGTRTSLSVKRALVTASGYSIEGTGKLDFSDPSKLGFEAKLSLKDIPYALKGDVAGRGVSISGDYGLKVTATSQGKETYVSAQAKSLPLPIGGGLFLATVDAEGRFASMEDWELEVAALELAPTGEKMERVPELALTGRFTPSRAELSSLRVSDKFSKLAGKAELSYSFARPFVAKIGAELASEAPAKAGAPAESYKLELSYSGGELDGGLDLVASPLARAGKLPIEGSADGRLTLGGDLSDPRLGFSLRLRDGHLLEQSLSLSLSGSFGGGALELRELAAAYQGQAVSAGSARFSLSDASASVSLAFSGSVGGEAIKCGVSARGASTRPGRPKSLEEFLSGYEASGVIGGLSVGAGQAQDWPFSAKSEAGAMSLVAGLAGELRLSYAPGGRFSASLRSPFPVMAELAGSTDGKSIDMTVRGLDFDLGLVSRAIPANIVQIRGGRARGGFRAVGLLGDPEITGEVDLVDAVVRVPGWVADDIGPFNAPIVAQGRKVSANSPAARVGSAAAALDFQASFDHWLPSAITASARTLERSTLNLDAVILGIHAKGAAAVDIKFALQGDVFSIDADVALDKATVVVSTEALSNSSSSRDSGGSGPTLAVKTNIRFGRSVQVSFSPISIPVVMGYADPSSSLAVNYDEASEAFTLKGTVALRGGEVFYIQRNFFLKSGKLVFNEGNDRFEPRVTLLAELRDSNDDGPVIITLRADNAPLSSFKPRLSSDPAMTEAQIAVLLGQDLFGASSDNSVDIRKAVISGTEFIPQLNVTRVLQDNVREAFGLDMLYLRTKVLQNWLFDISATKAEKEETNTMSRYLDQTEFYAGKYLTDSIFAHVSLGYRDDPLAGPDESPLNSELGVELDTPFGLIQWNVDPKKPENLLISDQSLSLSWKLSY